MNVPLQVWYDLILIRLDLESLINMKRTCKRFSKYNRLNHLIEIKEKELFGDFNRKCWNKLHKTKDISLTISDEFAKHILITRRKRLIGYSYYLGIYSSFEKLDKDFKSLPRIHKFFHISNRSACEYLCQSIISLMKE